jgi:AAA domain
LVAAVFDRLAGSEGLTAQASTFAREDVIIALGAGLVGATRAELDALADRFLAERAVSVVADRAVEERRWSTPELLGVEERLVAAAVGRTSERAGVASHEAVRAALAAHPSLGGDQVGMVRDVCQGGAGVQVVVGRPGTGKTFTLGAARHAWQLDGYRLLAAAPTGIATVSLEAEGFEDVATVDRLLLDLDRSGERLDARTVLVVDEAGMVGSRKLTRLLEHAHQARAKVVLVGDDRQLAAIDAGGGFRVLRLRLGASELVENRRQLHAWERDAIELVRQGLVDEAVEAYREHGRMVAAESKPAMTLALLTDWWQAYREAEQNPEQDVVVLAARRDEVDRLNTACQQVLASNGRLGGDRRRVEDRQLAVGDRVVCGHNAIAQLGIANGTRGLVTAMDTRARTLTLRLDGPEAREVTLPGWYLDGEEVAGLISQRPWLVGAVEVELKGVDALKAQLRRPDRGEPVGPCELGEPVQQLRVGRFELDRVAFWFKACRVAGLGLADEVEGPLDQDERHRLCPSRTFRSTTPTHTHHANDIEPPQDRQGIGS